jgi:aminopeptidase
MLNFEKFALLLVDYCLEVKPKQTILVNADVVAQPLVEEIYKQLLIVGAFPKIEFSSPIFAELFYKYANEEQLRHVSPISIFQEKYIDSSISIRSQVNTKALANIDMDKHKIRSNALSELNQEIAKNRWVLTLFPTEGYAQEAEMSLRELSKFVSDALFLNTKNPVDSWSKLSKDQEEYIHKIENTDKVHIKSDNTDITFSIKDRLWINSDGKQNMPSGEIYTTPIEDSINGYFTSSFPSNKYGKEIDGVFLEFKNGKLLNVRASRNEDFLNKLLDTDNGAKIIGEFGIGLNYGIVKPINNILFDEKIGGTVHIALGQSYEKTGGKNKSNIHLDLISDLRNFGEITFDDKILYKNGRFLIL